MPFTLYLNSVDINTYIKESDKVGYYTYLMEFYDIDEEEVEDYADLESLKEYDSWIYEDVMETITIDYEEEN